MLKLLMKSLDESDCDEESQASSKASVNPNLALFEHDN
jgi:hypothetical protein